MICGSCARGYGVDIGVFCALVLDEDTHAPDLIFELLERGEQREDDVRRAMRAFTTTLGAGTAAIR